MGLQRAGHGLHLLDGQIQIMRLGRLKGMLPGNQIINQHTQRINIGSAGDIRQFLALFRRQNRKSPSSIIPASVLRLSITRWRQ